MKRTLGKIVFAISSSTVTPTASVTMRPIATWGIVAPRPSFGTLRKTGMLARGDSSHEASGSFAPLPPTWMKKAAGSIAGS